MLSTSVNPAPSVPYQSRISVAIRKNAGTIRSTRLRRYGPTGGSGFPCMNAHTNGRPIR
jgi:hypothetical protein